MGYSMKADMACESVEKSVVQLESLTAEVIHALVELRAEDVLALVVKQCECMRELSGCVLDGDQGLRMQRIAERVWEQQELIAQTLRTSEHFIRQVQQSNPFSQTC